MHAPTNGNLFDNVEPHLHLPPQARAALWSACELVLARPDDFADAVAWLDSEYSEAAMRERVLRDSRTIYRRQLRAVQQGVDPCDTFPRHKALRQGRPREELVRDTIQTALSRGWRIEGDKVATRNSGNEKNLVDAGNVEMVWRWLDERCQQHIRQIKAEYRKEDNDTCKQAKHRGWRLGRAVQDAMEVDLTAGKEERIHARRVVLLACLLAYPHGLPLPGEFCSWEWENEGHLFLALHGGHFVPGRQSVLFDLGDPQGRESAPGILNVGDFDGFVGLVGRAATLLGVQEAPPTLAEGGNGEPKATYTVAASVPDEAQTPPDGEWSCPMTLKEMATRLGVATCDKARPALNRYGLRNAGSRQSWEVRVDTMPANVRYKFET